MSFSIKALDVIIAVLALLETSIWLLTFVMPSSFKNPQCEFRPDYIAVALSGLILLRIIFVISKKLTQKREEKSS